MKNRPNFFIAGCQKTGSTWLYKCFQEHPEIYVPAKDAIHYFTVNYFRGVDWYARWFNKAVNERIICDPTPSYIRYPHAAKRIYDFNPEAKLLFVLRNPVERAFSHYYHQKRKGRVGYSFEDTLSFREVGNIDTFLMWISAGFYHELLRPFWSLFDPLNIKIQIFDDLKEDPEQFLKEIYEYLEVPFHYPSVLYHKVNAAPKAEGSGSGWRSSFLKRKKTGVENLRDIDPKVLEDLKAVFKPDIEKLSYAINRDLLKLWL